MSDHAQVQPDAQIDETVRFVQQLFQASVIIFGWTGHDDLFRTDKVVGAPPLLMDEYLGGMHRQDPLDVYKLIARKERVALLESRCPSFQSSSYKGFMDYHGLVDEADLIFWDGDRPLAVLGVLKRPGDPPFSHDNWDWENIRHHLEFNLRRHPHARQQRQARHLLDELRLTPREMEVVSLLQIGASNAKIGAILGIGIPTVKTYIVNILDKLGVDNRTSIVSYVSTL